MSKCLVLFVEGDKGVQEGQRIDVGAAEWLILLYLCSCGYLNYLKIVYEHLI